MAIAIHHSVVVTRDLDQSLRFYRDGLGLTVLRDMHADGLDCLYAGRSTDRRSIRE